MLLATAVNIEDIKKIYSEFPNIIKGFGELKCYSSYQDKQVPYKKISFVKQVCKFSNNCGNLPVYLHWEIENEKDIKILKKLLTQYPTVPIVLCHCGMNEFNKDYAYIQSNYLANQFENLWLDISYVALDYFYENQLKINTLPKHKIIFGTDVNNKLLGPGHDFPQEYDDKIFKMIKMMKYANSNNNLKRLFKGTL